MDKPHSRYAASDDASIITSSLLRPIELRSSDLCPTWAGTGLPWLSGTGDGDTAARVMATFSSQFIGIGAVTGMPVAASS